LDAPSPRTAFSWAEPSLPPLSANATLRWSIVEPIIDRLEPDRILEIGCGQGGFGARLASRAEYIGVETDLDSCRVAQARIGPVGGRVLHGSVEALEDDRAFDLVCAFEVLEHIERDVEALEEWSRLVRPGGAVLVSVPAWPDRFGAGDSLVGHYRRYTPAQLGDAFSRAGLREVESTMYGWPLLYLTEPLRNVIARRFLDHRPSSMQERTARSGRSLQKGGPLGRAMMAAATPFAYAQRLRPSCGLGIVALGRT
jgi:SAM-dependent methyltransferase